MRLESMDANAFSRNADYFAKDSPPERTELHAEDKTQEIHQEVKAKREEPMNDQQLYKAIEKANEAAMGRNTSFRYAIHEGTKQIMVKVLDKKTNEVIRELPPEKILDMVAKIWEMAGLFVDEKR